MDRKVSHHLKFKPYNQEQGSLFPTHLSTLIPPGHLVRVVDEFVEQVDMKLLYSTYSPEGCKGYHPRMLLKVLVYGYITKNYSCRLIAKACRANVHFMWLAASQQPDFRTINDFRGERMQDIIDEVFTETVLYLVEQGYIDLEDYITDGTVLRADANKHSAVWRKNTERYKAQALEKIRALLARIDEINAAEDAKYGSGDLPENGEGETIDSEAIRQKAKALSAQLAAEEATNKATGEKPDEKHREQKKLAKELSQKAEQLKKYEEQEKVQDGRNSFSKTDPDATFMRDKDGLLVPGYNLMIGGQHQFITNVTISQSTSDMASFIPHIESYHNKFDAYPANIAGDAGFGSEENYEHLAEKEINNYLKFPGFDREGTKKYLENIFHKDHFPYDAHTDTYTCPNGKALHFIEEKERKNASGYISKLRVYEAESCDGCLLANQCKKAEGNRRIYVSPKLETHKEKTRKNLNNPKGIELRKRRGTEIETPFGDIKHNQRYRRFMLRGLEKVNVEAALISLSHNIRKVAIARQESYAQDATKRAEKQQKAA